MLFRQICGVSLGTVAYSNDGGLSYSYTPIPDPQGFDAAVNAIRITMAGQMAANDLSGAPSFDLIFLARIN